MAKSKSTRLPSGRDLKELFEEEFLRDSTEEFTPFSPESFSNSLFRLYVKKLRMVRQNPTAKRHLGGGVFLFKKRKSP